jgi:hypothetical protein
VQGVPILETLHGETRSSMRLLIVTSCTGEKALCHERRLTLEDFRKGADHIAAREQELSDLLLRFTKVGLHKSPCILAVEGRLVNQFR